MKLIKISAIVIISFFLTNLICAQEANKTELALQKANEIMTQLTQLNDIAQYIGFRKKAEQQIKDFMGRNPEMTPEQREVVQSNYNGLKLKFDNFVDVLKGDILNPNAYKDFTKHPEKYTGKYLTAYQDATIYYRDVYVPTLKQLEGKGGGPVYGEIFSLVVGGVNLIINAVQKHKMKKEATYDAFGLVNTQFKDILYMKSWEELFPDQPSLISVNSLSLESLDYKINTSTSSEIFSGKFKMQSINNSFSAPLISDINGDIKLVQKTELGYADVPLSIGGKNLKEASSEIISPSANNSVYCKTIKDYKPGSEFKLQVQTDGFVYIFTKNADGSIETLYPYDNNTLINAGFDTKNITQSNSEIAFRTIEASKQTLVVFPLQYGAEDKVYKIDAQGKEDNLIVIISRKQATEVNKLRQMIANGQMNFTTDDLSDVTVDPNGSILVGDNHDIVPIVITLQKKI